MQGFVLILQNIAPPGLGTDRSQPWTKVILSLALIAALSSFFVEVLVLKVFAVSIAAGLLGLPVVLWGYARLKRNTAKGLAQRMQAVIGKDSEKKFLVSSDGEVFYRNDAARDDGLIESNLIKVLSAFIVDAQDTLSRLHNAARLKQHATETLVTRKGMTDLCVTHIEKNLFLWEVTGRSVSTPAVPEDHSVPLITVGRNGSILFMNAAARGLFGDRLAQLSEILVDDVPYFGSINTLRTKSGLLPCFLQTIGDTRVRKEICILPAHEAAKGYISLTFEDLPVATLKLNCDGEILQANRAARGLINVDTLEGTGIRDLFEGLGRPLEDWLKEVSEGRSDTSTEFLRLKTESLEAFLQVTLGQMTDSDGGALYAVLNDATELKTLEAQFVQSQKMQAIGQLAGGVAHDFNNLLTAITGHCDLLLLRHDKGDEAFADLTQISQNANRAASLVGQLLAFSRKQTLQPEVSHLEQTLADLTHLLNRLVGDNYRLDVVNGDGLNAIRVDRQQFEQVIMNLVVNARDAMEGGGVITIETENLNLDIALVRDRATVPVGEYVSVEVRDTGVGIPEHKLQQVFEPFYTSKPVGEGTGLGLSTVYGIVKQSGGFIFVDSVVGEGTTFRLLFPAVSPEVQLTTEDATELPLALSPAVAGTVLLVEDEAPVRAFAARALRIKGLTVLEAGAATEALKILEDKELRIDLIVTDVIMPGLDGPSWVKKARAERPDTPVIFVSGYADGKFSEDRLSIENSTFLPKPFSLAQLTATVDKQLNRVVEGLV